MFKIIENQIKENLEGTHTKKDILYRKRKRLPQNSLQQTHYTKYDIEMENKVMKIYTA